MKDKHTPGPWSIGPAIDGEDGDVPEITIQSEIRRGAVSANLCVAVAIGGLDGQQQEANARLIAAAPVMLAALRSMRCAIEAQILGAKAARHGPDVEVIDTFIEDCQDDLDLINDAIALATGESP
jgi:hypothetical protein